eukprot:Phypoly_transcript_19571.p1 GENE.Phypoly_transcript_19571~~Phypoly_transcript_19571.p1  ORF type:complete len:182 (+),score=36.06 Phypoly_transcript_19571:153-698(+)
MASLFDKIFPRIKRPPPESAIEPRQPLQPAANEPKDPILECIRQEIKEKRDIHTYGYEADLESFATYLVQNKNRPSRREREASKYMMEELKKEEGKPVVLGNPRTMWAYGVGGACIGFALAGALMRKHVEPLTTLTFSSLTGFGAYTGAKLDELGYLPPLSFLSQPPPQFPPQPVPTRSYT